MKYYLRKILFTAFLFFISIGHADYQNFEPKDFSYLLGKTPGLEPSLLRIHFKLYEGYVKNTNHLIQTLQQMSSRGEDRTLMYGALKRRLGWEYDGMILHEYYFENLGGYRKPGLKTSSKLYKQLTQTFGSYQAWKQNFADTGLIRGIGWVILYVEPKDKQLLTVWVNEHDLGHIANGTPILVMDVWEHAYLTEYGLDRAAYIHSFLNNIDWEVVEKRYEEALNRK